MTFDVDYLAFAPEFVVIGTLLLVFALDLILPRTQDSTKKQAQPRIAFRGRGRIRSRAKTSNSVPMTTNSGANAR